MPDSTLLCCLSTAEHGLWQVFVTSKDGTKVPLFIIRRKDAPLDGTSPALLYGYGGMCQPVLSKSHVCFVARVSIITISNELAGSLPA